MIFKKIILYIISIIFLHSCSGVKDVLEGKKRSENSDEFLVEKKNPLKLPPDFDQLPVPNSENDIKKHTKEDAVKDLITSNNSTSENIENNNGQKNKNLENFLLEKIKNN